MSRNFNQYIKKNNALIWKKTNTQITREFFITCSTYEPFLKLKRLYNKLFNSKNDTYIKFCNIYVTVNNILPLPDICGSFINKLNDLNNFTIILQNNKNFPCIKEHILQIPYIKYQLNDLNNNINKLTFYKLNFSKSTFDIIINYLWGIEIYDKINIYNFFELLNVTEYLLIPDFFDIILLFLLHNYTFITFIKDIHNITNNINNIITLTILLIDNIYKPYIKEIIKLHYPIIYKTIMDNRYLCNFNIFIFQNWNILFTEKEQLEAIIMTKMYINFNKSTISSKKIVKFLLAYDLTSNIYNKILNRYNWKSIVIYQSDCLKPITIHKLPYVDITIITSYYPQFNIIIYKKLDCIINYINTYKFEIILNDQSCSISIYDEIILCYDTLLTLNILDYVHIKKIEKCFNNYCNEINKAKYCNHKAVSYKITLKNSIKSIYNLNEIWIKKSYAHDVNLKI